MSQSDIERVREVVARHKERGSFVARDTLVFLPDNAGGFAVAGCPDPEALAARIAATLNACVGFPTKTLEDKGFIGAIDAVERARDELIEALRGLMGLVELIDAGAGATDPQRVPHVSNHRYIAAQEALAKHAAKVRQGA